jgi:integrase/recombinase XerD
MKIASTRRFAERDTLLILFSYGLGLRAIEMCSLKVRDIIADDWSVNEVVELQRTKGNKPRAMYLTDPKIRAAIQRYMDWRLAYQNKRKIYLNGNHPFFISQKANMSFTNITLAMLFKRIYQEAGIKASSHSGRRTFATNLLEQGIDVKSLQLLMGHANISETMAYVEGNPERMKKIVMNALY